MSEMPIEQTVGAGSSPTYEENGALREKLGDITLDCDQVLKYRKYIECISLLTWAYGLYTILISKQYINKTKTIRKFYVA